MGAPRYGPLATVVVTLLVLSALAPVMTVFAATDMFPDAVYKGSLDSLSPRDDYNFTARANEWTVLAVNNNEGKGAFRHGLRTDRYCWTVSNRFAVSNRYHPLRR